MLFWRPVARFSPSEQAYAPAVKLVDLDLAWLRGLQERGLIRPDADVGDVHRASTVLMSGVISQQMSNAPDESFADGQFTGALPDLVAMFARHYGASTASERASGSTNKERRRARAR